MDILALTEGETIALITIAPTFILGLVGYWIKRGNDSNREQIKTEMSTGNGSSLGKYVSAISENVALLNDKVDLALDKIDNNDETISRKLKDHSDGVGKEFDDIRVKLLETEASMATQLSQHTQDDLDRFGELQDNQQTILSEITKIGITLDEGEEI